MKAQFPTLISQTGRLLSALHAPTLLQPFATSAPDIRVLIQHIILRPASVLQTLTQQRASGIEKIERKKQ